MNYPLLPYSQLVFDMLKTNPDVYTYRTTTRISKDDIECERFKNAIVTALRNHPVFQTAVDEHGLQHFDEHIDPLHGQYHSLRIREDSAYMYIDSVSNRILGDAVSGQVLIEDVIRAYEGKPLAEDHYYAYLAQVEADKHSERYAADKHWLEQHFGDICCPVHPKTDVPLQDLEHAVEGVKVADYTDLHEALNRLADEQLVSLNALFSLASALAIMDYNGTNEAALTWAYDGRETEDEQRIYGSLHRDMPFRISRIADGGSQASRDELLLATRKAMREGIKHSSYPFTLTAPHTEIWNYALNVLVQPAPEAAAATLPISIEMLPIDKQQDNAYALLDVEIYETKPNVTLVFRYSATHYKEESIRKFAALVRKYAEWLTA